MFLERFRLMLVEAMAEGQPAMPLIAALCSEAERQIPGSVAGVTILDRTARVFDSAVFPSLSPVYANALRGIEVKDKPGSCALAVFDGRTVASPDVASDDRFSDGWKKLSLRHGLAALVSIPAKDRQGLVLGTLVVAHPRNDPLDEAQRELADEAAALAALILTYRRTQMQHELLVGELQHRVRNLFSTIGAVVFATLKSYPDPAAFRKMFDGRLAALAKAHSLALEPSKADLRDLLVAMLAPYSIDHQVEIEGPALMLSPEAAVAFSLAVHELATNAAKYGAFSRHGGAVRVEWQLAAGEDDGRFDMLWRERGGPRVCQPDRQGYGQRILHSSLGSAFDAEVELDYDPGGLLCRISARHSERLGSRLS